MVSNEEIKKRLESKKKVINQRSKIHESNHRICIKCGEVNPLNANYCQECGNNLEANIKYNSIICGHCGYKNKSGFKFCTNCGKELFEQNTIIDSKVEDELKIANELFYIEKNYDEALVFYNKSLEKNPELVEALFHKGKIYFHLKNNYMALDCFNKVIKLDSNYVEALKERGNVFLSQKKYHNAIKSYDQALEIDLNNFELWYNKGIALFNLNSFENSLKSFNYVFNLDSDYKDTLINIGILLLNLEHYENSIKIFNKILDKNPDSILALNNKGLAFYYLKNYDESLKCYNKAIKLFDNINNRVFEYSIESFGISQDIHSIYNSILKNRDNTIEKIKSAHNKEKLISSGNYTYIKNFVHRYQDHYHTAEIMKLKELIEVKGISLTYEELKEIIIEEHESDNYNAFKSRILDNEPITLKDYVKNLMDIYGENYKKEINLFKLLLKENDIYPSTEQINEIVELIKKENELLIFEKELEISTEAGISPFMSIYDIDNLNGYEFEYFLKALFEKMGYNVENTPLSGDQGADLVINRFSERIVVQAKRYNDKVSNKAVQEVVASIAQYNAHKGIVATNNEFTLSAIELARSNDVELIDRYKLENLIKQYPISRVEIDFNVTKI